MIGYFQKKREGGTTVLNYDSGTISARLEQSEKELVSGVRFSMEEGRSLALIGETGSGKTMIARSIMGLLPGNVQMKDGKILFCGDELTGRSARKLLGDRIVYIPQNGLESLNPSRKIRHHLYDNLKKIGIPRAELEQEALSKLALVGFPEPEKLLDKYPFQLSGGMAQRVTIAISACSRGALMIADEPTNGLDDGAKLKFMELLQTVFPHAAKLMITHDITLAELCDETLVLCGGRMMEKGPSSQILHAPRNQYTCALILSLVKNGMRETPVLRSETGVCPFFRRCQAAKPSCQVNVEHHQSGQREWWCNHLI